MKNLKNKLVIFLVLAGLAYSAMAQTKKAIVYPGATWEKVSDSIHWDNKKMNDLLKYVTDSTQVTGMTVVHGGKQIFEYGDLKELSYIASCRKSICAILYGPYVERGKINLKTTIGELGIDDVGGLLPIEKTATVDDILTARSGVFHPASNGGDALYLAPKRGTKKPGTFWLYSNWDFNLAGYILEKAAGKEIHLLVESMLAKPLEMQDWDLKAQEIFKGDTTKSKYPPLSYVVLYRRYGADRLPDAAQRQMER
jgi:CubicO group peptidase (beta-lactamase class C family)